MFLSYCSCQHADINNLQNFYTAFPLAMACGGEENCWQEAVNVSDKVIVSLPHQCLCLTCSHPLEVACSSVPGMQFTWLLIKWKLEISKERLRQVGPYNN